MRSQLGCALALALTQVMAVGCLRFGSGVPESDSDGRMSVGPRSARPLYVRLGGVDGIRTVVDEMVSRVAADPRIQRFFVDTDFRRFKGQLVVLICQATGGPCRYRGRPMRDVHRGRKIHSADFDAMMEDARAALRAAQLGVRERRELHAILRSLKPQIVEDGK
jgi:hemoglobin